MQPVWVSRLFCSILTQHKGCSRCGWGGPSPSSCISGSGKIGCQKPIAKASQAGHFGVSQQPVEPWSSWSCGWDAGRSEQDVRLCGLHLARAPEQDQAAGSTPNVTPRAGSGSEGVSVGLLAPAGSNPLHQKANWPWAK